MNETLTKLQSVAVGSGGSSTITFNNIPQNYTDLVIKMSVRAGASGPMDAYLIFQDGSGTTNYSWVRISGDGGGGGLEAYGASNSGTLSPLTMQGTDATAGVFTSAEITILNYTSSAYKTISSENVTENNGSTARTSMSTGLWKSTSPVTSLQFSVAGGFTQYSVVTVYGVRNMTAALGGALKATGGDSIQFDGTYVTHIFQNSGVFTPKTSLPLQLDYLVVAGGGGGASSNGTNGGGGGGAGGLLSNSYGSITGGSLNPTSLIAQGSPYTITVGAGGSANSNGANSSISKGSTVIVSSIGGGAGNGGAGGSGGGGASGGGTGGTPTTNQGFTGGAGNYYNSSSFYCGGGGGGAGGAGTGGSTGGSSLVGGGAGGVGVYLNVNGSSTYYAEGGWGGAGQNAGSYNGVASTSIGGGGGGSGAGGSASAGKAGIVVIRYRA